MKIAIIGAGWYGCHIAQSVRGYCDTLDIYEKNKSLLSEASGNNQFRLHQGLHYPRSSKTRYESRDGFYRFQERYPNFSKDIENNIYLVPKSLSILDFNTYYAIMLGSGLDIEKIKVNELNFLNSSLLEGALVCKEKIILTNNARQYFWEQLKDHLKLGHSIKNIEHLGSKLKVDGEVYDYVIDATWGAFTALNPELINYFYEPTILFYLRLKLNGKFPAITLMDGSFASIYPTEVDNVYTLSSVEHTPCGKYFHKRDAYDFLENISNEFIENKWDLMQKEISLYVENFNEQFELIKPQFSIKTKPVSKSDDRSLRLKRIGNYFSVLPGKIDNIFQASDWILGELTRQ